MKIGVTDYRYCTTEKDRLIEGKDFEIIGFVQDNSIFSKFIDILQPVYLLGEKTYVLRLLEYPLMDIVKSIESSYEAWGVDLEYIKNFINNLAIYISKDDFFLKEYILAINSYNVTLKMSDLQSDEVIKEDVICLTEKEYVAAIKLPDGKIAVGSEEFLEKTIMERIEDMNGRFDLLVTLYDNLKDYYKKEELINDIFNNHLEELNEEEQRKIKRMKSEHDFIMQGIRIAEDIRDTYKGVKIRRV